jgi:predicted transcriptional regulator of viral defense system
MGKVIYLKKVREFMKITPAFRVRDIELIVRNRNYAHLILHKLAEKKEINRIMKGWYSLYDDPIVSVFCFKPAYLGLQEALSMHNLWEQETNIVIVTTRKVRTGVREIFGSNVVLHRIEQKYFFGFDLMRYENFFIPVSDVEKTFIDLVYFNEIPAGEVLKNIEMKLNRKKLNEYLKNYPTRFKRKVKELLEFKF